MQDVTASEVAGIIRHMRESYSEWTAYGVYRILKDTFGLAVRRGIVTRSPVDGLAPSERPKQRNAKKVRRLAPAEIELAPASLN